MKINDSIAQRTDHLGNIYESINKMSDSYNIEPSTYRDRIKRGWDKEKALTIPINPNYKKSKTEADELERRTDHLGHTFPTIREMAEHWGIKRTTLLKRLSSGMSVREALKLKLNHSRNLVLTISETNLRIKKRCVTSTEYINPRFIEE
ncbi:hypothetical protein DWV94_09565 [Streptococcus salivarius]|nr:hypothetical protein DWV94_09565 [Streptococcus salivarius]